MIVWDKLVEESQQQLLALTEVKPEAAKNWARCFATDPSERLLPACLFKTVAPVPVTIAAFLENKIMHGLLSVLRSADMIAILRAAITELTRIVVVGDYFSENFHTDISQFAQLVLLDDTASLGRTTRFELLTCLGQDDGQREEEQRDRH